MRTAPSARWRPALPDNHHPSDQPLAIAPRLIELCFQTAGLWEMAVQHRMGLPRHVDRVWLYRAPDAAAGPLFAVVTANPAAGSFDADVVDRAGTRYLHVSGYRTVVVPRRRGCADVRSGAGRDGVASWTSTGWNRARATCPLGTQWLSGSERARLDGLHIPKRRADWRLGRWTAKCAVAVYLKLSREPEALAAVELRPAPSGAPEVFLHGRPAPVALSLSHSRGTGLCAIAPAGAAGGVRSRNSRAAQRRRFSPITSPMRSRSWWRERRPPGGIR